MPVVSGTRLTLSDTVGLAVDMSPVINLIDPYDVGLLSYIGMSSLDKACTETEHKWMEDTLRPLTSTITDNPLSNVATTINVAAGTGAQFRAGDIVKIEDELIRITGDGTPDDLVTVASPNGRGWGGSTAAQHAQNSVIEIVGVTVAEGEPTPRSAITTVKTSVSNYTQIFEDVCQVSSTLESVEQWAPGSEYARQLAKTMKSLMILIDKTLIYGKPAARAAGNSNTGALGGLRHFIATNVATASGAQLSENILLDRLMAAYDYGGNPKALASSLTQKRAFNKFLDPNRRTDFAARTAGAIVDMFEWDNGTLDVVIDRWLPKDEMLGLDSEYLGFGPLQGNALGHEILPKSSRLTHKGQITGEYTAEVKVDKAHFRQYGLATTII